MVSGQWAVPGRKKTPTARLLAATWKLEAGNWKLPMLVELHIQDFAIIDRLDLTFEPGFIVLTGETGAGKSIIIDAVELLLGGRSDAAQVRSGAVAALLEGTFRIPEALLADVRLTLEESELEVEEGHLTLAREVRKEGRSVCRINGRTVNLGMLKEVGDRLVDVHGQS
ncbi:MAG TPA: AAA family ATPase, partial [Anaerolineales bacterium]